MERKLKDRYLNHSLLIDLNSLYLIYALHWTWYCQLFHHQPIHCLFLKWQRCYQRQVWHQQNHFQVFLTLISLKPNHTNNHIRDHVYTSSLWIFFSCNCSQGVPQILNFCNIVNRCEILQGVHELMIQLLFILFYLWCDRIYHFYFYLKDLAKEEHLSKNKSK